MSEANDRQRYVDAALAYCGTNYHHMAKIKGVGVDCATLLICAGVDAGLIEDFDLEYYPPDWALHRDEERYLRIVSKYCHEVAPPAQPGDIAVWRMGRCFSHAAVVVQWPQVVHAVVNCKVATEDAEACMWLRYENNKPRPMKLFSFWER